MASNKTNITLPRMPTVEVHMNGEWVKVDNLVNGMDVSVLKGYNNGTDKFSKLIINKVRSAIRSGRPPSGSGIKWPPLSKKYIDRFNSKYPGHHIYYLSGLYSRSIGIYKYKNRSIIGLPYNSRPGSKSKTITLVQIAIILEYGSRDDSIPARPLWKPSLKSVGGISRLKKEILTSIRSQLSKDFGLTNSQIRINK